MVLRYEEIGERLKAFRLGSKLSTDEIAKRIDVSRSVLYRLERGELVKLETLEKLSDLLDVSLPTLLGVGTEYIPSAVTYWERLRQIELRANQIVVLSGPFSFLLASDNFQHAVAEVLRESVNYVGQMGSGNTASEIEQIISILDERRRNYKTRKPHLVNLVSGRDIERFLRSGLRQSDGELSSRGERRQVVLEETKRLASLVETEAIGLQFGLFTLPLPRFHMFRQPDKTVLSMSPFRLAEEPNTTIGVAMITSDPDALRFHEEEVSKIWADALKGASAAEYIRRLIQQVMRDAEEPRAQAGCRDRQETLAAGAKGN
jgi:transcriptional regulator with XRE-family HTH domain